MGYYEENLIKKVLEFSVSNKWEEAIYEWNVTDVVEDPFYNRKDYINPQNVCACKKEKLKYLFTITNKINKNKIFPIGSTCIRKFGINDMDQKVSVLLDMMRLKHAIEKGEFLVFSNELFTRKLLDELYRIGAFPPNRYNDYDGENDYNFMVKMFNKKNSLSEAQEKKVTAIIIGSFKPFLEERFRIQQPKMQYIKTDRTKEYQEPPKTILETDTQQVNTTIYQKPLSIAEFKQIEHPVEQDYARLQSGGCDQFSALKYKQLIELIDNPAIIRYVEKFVPNTKYASKTLRWILRGLTPKEAVLKNLADKQEIIMKKKNR